MPDMNTCRIIPLAGHQVAFELHGREVLRWNSGADSPRPFFFPVRAPSGALLTRMGHPGAPDHDHHQSIWFAHHKVLGIDFWGNTSTAIIRQKQWLAYDDGENACRMAVELLWSDGHDPAPLLTQQLICEVASISEDGEFTLELQSRFTPVAESLEFGQTNFGFLAVRVAKEVSAHFGGGVLTSSTGATTEAHLFEQPATWIDYSGPTGAVGMLDAPSEFEGITYLDHPSNPGQPTRWHVRDDGWWCASPCMRTAVTATRGAPLELRYKLIVHAGAVDMERTQRLLADFENAPRLAVAPGPRPHTRWTVVRS